MAPELRHLRALLAAAEHGTLTDAARELHISQPTLSRTLQQLERMAGSTLLVRTPYGVELTEAGDRALSRAREIVDRVDMFLPALTGTQSVRLGFAWLLPPDWFSALRESCRRLGVAVTPVRMDEPVAALSSPAADRVDLALFRNTHRELPEGIDSLLLGTESRCATFPADSDLARRHMAGEVIRWDDLSDEPLVTNPNSGTTWAGSWAPGASERELVECSNFEEWIELVAAGAGIGAVPDLARVRAPHPGVLYADLPDIPQSDLALAWSKESVSPTVQELLRTVPTLDELPVR